ncbi:MULTISPECIES: type II secretion system F family protein [Paenibacillus]|uniref:type II secretion system F family protein n=1 Tax=Paenibacillus TaxID=44249 RepID=UPI0022B8FC51|nr:type II secretion system F family protein [Paenibacillus caseinilyticus]MCZ8521511.1 type II secretion system F family protein [Paenibacillus caseinilyticus]
MLLLLLALLAAAAGAARAGRPLYGTWVSEHRGLKPSELMYWGSLAALWLIDRTRLSDKLSEPLGKVFQIMVGLHGARPALAHTKWFAAKAVVLAYAMFCLSVLGGWAAGGNAEMLIYGFVLMLFVPIMMYRGAAGELTARKRQMLMELPELLNRIMLLVGAGETVPQALVRTVEANREKNSPLYEELGQTVQALKMNASFAKAMEDFSKRCRMQEVSLFTTTILLNYKRGGDELVMTLKELSLTLWDKRKAQARTLGEEASSKMVFPMVLIFFVVMVLVAAPALFMMQS